MRFLIKKDKHKRLYFAPIQGIAAQAILPLEYRESIDTIVYQHVAEDGLTTLHIRSEAGLLALIDTGSFWRHLARLTRLLPRSFRDWFYDAIVRNRHKWFKSAACKLPSKAEHERILP